MPTLNGEAGDPPRVWIVGQDSGKSPVSGDADE